MKDRCVSKTVDKVLVVGATGSIGRYVIAEGARCGYSMRALTRRSAQAGEFLDEVETVVGDLTDPASLTEAVAGVDAIIFTHGSNGRPPGPEAVDYGAVRNIIQALDGRTVRITLMTTVGVTDRKGAHDWKRRGERLIRLSGLPYTIVRPGWFDFNAPNQNRIVMLQGDTRQSGTPQDGVIGRTQIAQVLLWSLRSEVALNKTFELSAEAGLRQKDLDIVARQLDPDVSGALDAIRDAANMPIEAEPTRIRDELDRVRSFSSPVLK
jgi:uncharacterized protein YbjT (DUF2867 family)